MSNFHDCVHEPKRECLICGDPQEERVVMFLYTKDNCKALGFKLKNEKGHLSRSEVRASLRYLFLRLEEALIDADLMSP